ncbi:hypothetical protein [Bradyrhizobium sp. 142]|nr:hypothetical protein [Bradyrhizobium sp. 142]MCK1725936.1 hypothetical protein [Bradyrhizobium sp. 142]
MKSDELMVDGRSNLTKEPDGRLRASPLSQLLSPRSADRSASAVLAAFGWPLSGGPIHRRRLNRLAGLILRPYVRDALRHTACRDRRQYRVAADNVASIKAFATLNLHAVQELRFRIDLLEVGN